MRGSPSERYAATTSTGMAASGSASAASTSSVASSDQWRSSSSTSAGPVLASAQRSASNSVARSVSGRRLAELGEQPREVGPQRPARGERARPRVQQRPQRRDERPVRRRAALRGRAAEHRHAGVLRQRGGEPALADARLAGEQHDPALAGAGALEQRIEPGELRFASDESGVHGASLRPPLPLVGEVRHARREVRHARRWRGRARAERAGDPTIPTGSDPSMQLYVIMRRNGWRTADDLEAAAARSAEEGEELGSGVRWIRSYVPAEESGELGTVCIYEAASAEALRAHADARGPARPTRSCRSPRRSSCARTRRVALGRRRRSAS